MHFEPYRSFGDDLRTSAKFHSHLTGNYLCRKHRIGCHGDKYVGLGRWCETVDLVRRDARHLTDHVNWHAPRSGAGKRFHWALLPIRRIRNGSVMLAISNASDTGQNLASGAIYHCTAGRSKFDDIVWTAIVFFRGWGFSVLPALLK